MIRLLSMLLLLSFLTAPAGAVGRKKEKKVKEKVKVGTLQGNQAPEIEGVNVAGKPMKLSDFRGKVTVLTFWGTWCGPCMAMLPHERELVEKHAKDDFAFVSVNTDPLPTIKRMIKKREVTWENWCDGSPDGPICRAYRVSSFPTIFVLDRAGIIRYIDVRGEELEAAIETLLAKSGN